MGKPYAEMLLNVLFTPAAKAAPTVLQGAYLELKVVIWLILPEAYACLKD